MGELDHITRLPDDFDGNVRLFPLPSLVLFPHAMQPLHIFEPRYCEMLSDAMQSDELIAMATLGDALGADAAPSGLGDATRESPLVSPTVCVGKIVSHVELEDDRHNILLVGIKRARIAAEVDAGRCYRIARIDVLEDSYSPEGNGHRGQLRSDLVKAFGNVIPSTESVKQGLGELLSGKMELGPITDIIAHTLPLSVAKKIELLDQSNVDLRAERLIDFISEEGFKIESLEADKSDSGGLKGKDSRLPFPPLFSIN